MTLCPTFADLRRGSACSTATPAIWCARARQFEAAKEANPQYVQARLLLGRAAAQRTVRTTPAMSEFEAVLAQDPENKSAQMYLRIAKRKSEAPPATGDSKPSDA